MESLGGALFASSKPQDITDVEAVPELENMIGRCPGNSSEDIKAYYERYKSAAGASAAKVMQSYEYMQKLMLFIYHSAEKRANDILTNDCKRYGMHILMLIDPLNYAGDGVNIEGHGVIDGRIAKFSADIAASGYNWAKVILNWLDDSRTYTVREQQAIAQAFLVVELLSCNKNPSA
jgi:hypothetical protein